MQCAYMLRYPDPDQGVEMRLVICRLRQMQEEKICCSKMPSTGAILIYEACLSKVFLIEFKIETLTVDNAYDTPSISVVYGNHDQDLSAVLAVVPMSI